jgi:hypothetical protein
MFFSRVIYTLVGLIESDAVPSSMIDERKLLFVLPKKILFDMFVPLTCCYHFLGQALISYYILFDWRGNPYLGAPTS